MTDERGELVAIAPLHHHPHLGPLDAASGAFVVEQARSKSAWRRIAS